MHLPLGLNCPHCEIAVEWWRSYRRILGFGEPAGPVSQAPGTPWVRQASKALLAMTRLARANRVRICGVFFASPL